MAAIETEFRDWLKDNTAVKAVVGTRIYPTFLPQLLPGLDGQTGTKDRWQAITMPVTGESNEFDQDSDELANSMTFSLRCHAYHTIEEVAYTDALALLEIIKAQLRGNLTFASYLVLATCGSRQDEPLAEMEGKSGFVQTIAVSVELVW